MQVTDGRQAMQHLLHLSGGPPDAIFGAGDSVLLGALQVLKEQGLAVPEQVALVGFSNEGFTTIIEPSLSSVDQRCEAMGVAAVRLFLELVATHDEVLPTHRLVLQPKLLVRASSLRMTAVVPAGGQLVEADGELD